MLPALAEFVFVEGLVGAGMNIMTAVMTYGADAGGMLAGAAVLPGLYGSLRRKHRRGRGRHRAGRKDGSRPGRAAARESA